MLNLNQAPYYDDFDATKNYHKILFVPGNPVQARELTQIQSILQHQIKQQGDHLFKNGTMVIPGNVYYDNRVMSIKLAKLYNGISVDSYLPNLVGQTVAGTFGVTAKVVHYEPSTATTNPYIFIKYTSSSGGVSEFIKNETLTYSTYSVAVNSSDDFSATGAICYISEGVFYINGYFIGVDNQVVTVSTSVDDSTTCSVGLQLTEQIVTAVDDSSLYDNSQGYSNYSAPGADRYKISLTLVKTNYSDTVDTEQFIKLLDVVEGSIYYLNNKTQYSEINKMLARRTYDESGDFVVTPTVALKARHQRKNHYINSSTGQPVWKTNTFYMKGDCVIYTDGSSVTRGYYTTDSGISGATPPTHAFGKVTDGSLNWTQIELNMVPWNGGASSYTTPAAATVAEAQMQIAMSPLKAYIKGFEVETPPTTFTVAKARDTVTKTESIDVPLGEHVLIYNIAGSGALDISTVQAGIIKDSSAAQVGTCWIKSIEYDSTDAAATKVFRLYIFGVAMSTGKNFSDHAYTINVGATFTCSIYLQNTNMSGVVTTTGSTGVVSGKLTRFRSEISVGSRVKLGALEYTVASITNDFSMTVSGTPVALTDASIILRNALYNTQSNNYMVALPAMKLKALRDASNNLSMAYTISVYKAIGVAAGTTATITLSGGNDTFVNTTSHVVFETNVGVTSIVFPTFTYANGNTQMTLNGLTNGRTYNAVCIVRRLADATKEKVKTLKVKTIILDQTKIYDGDTLGTITSGYTFASNKFPLTEADITRVISVKMSGGTPSAAYTAVNEQDISRNYYVIQNTKPEFYGMPMMMSSSTNMPTAPIKVTFEYFDHSTGDFFSKNSYDGVLDELVPALNNSASISLGEVLDFRSRTDDTGTGWNTGNGAFISSSLYSQSSINVTYTHYLPRFDVVSVGPDGAPTYITGKSAEWKGLTYPTIPSGHLVIAKIFVPPNPAKMNIDFSYEVQQYKRYTMHDIGRMDDRLKSVEEYVSLTLLEKQATDLVIKDENGLDRFKNGIVVDNFTTSAIADVKSTDFKADMSPPFAQGALTPLQATDHIGLIEFDSSLASRTEDKYQVTGGVASLPYTVKPAISQKVASTPEFINPFNVVVYEGEMRLFPAQDVWQTETTTETYRYV